MTTIKERTLRILAEVADTPRVLTEPDLSIFEHGLLDSLGTVTLIAQLSEEFGVDISPAEFERKNWATPAKIVEDMERRTGA
jgi:D-alanine--poly(phosphoribitol) ligase subunit 2